MMPITVIVLVYKTQQFLCRCVDSILNQTFTNFHLVLIDDSSPDSCGRGRNSGRCSFSKEKHMEEYVLFKT